MQLLDGTYLEWFRVIATRTIHLSETTMSFRIADRVGLDFNIKFTKRCIVSEISLKKTLPENDKIPEPGKASSERRIKNR